MPGDNSLPGATIVNVSAGQLVYYTEIISGCPEELSGDFLGKLAAAKAINNICCRGAVPLLLCVSFIHRNGSETDPFMRQLWVSMTHTARQAQVSVVRGDSKSVAGMTGIHLTVSGMGYLAKGNAFSCQKIQPGDVIVSLAGIGECGLALVALKKQMPLINLNHVCLFHEVIQDLQCVEGVKLIRVPGRLGLNGTLRQIAEASQVVLEIAEEDLPVSRQISLACRSLGLDCLSLASDTSLLVFAEQPAAQKVIQVLNLHMGREAKIVGKVVDASSFGEVWLVPASGERRLLREQSPVE